MSRSTRWDWYWPGLSHLGEQEILNKEIFADGSAADDQVFGYIPRYDEYRYKPAEITGEFRSAIAGSLDPWHLSQKFDSLPTLNQTFIEEDPPIGRVVATADDSPHCIMDMNTSMRHARPMPTNAVPGMMDHF